MQQETSNNTPELVTHNEAAVILEITSQGFSHILRRGQIMPAITTAGRRGMHLFRKSDVDQLKAERVARKTQKQPAETQAA